MIERIDLVEHKFRYPTFKIDKLRAWLNKNKNRDEFSCVKDANDAYRAEIRLLANKGVVDACREWNSRLAWDYNDNSLSSAAVSIYRRMKREGINTEVVSQHVDISNLMRTADEAVQTWKESTL